jgi:hypothetical protein
MEELGMIRNSLYDQSDCLEWEFKVFETHT